MLRKKLLLILAVISFILPIAYFNWVYYVAFYSPPEQYTFIKQNYFIQMFDILRHWTTGEMGYFPIHSVVVGVVLLFIRKKWVKQN